jgi:hypothetical protein
VGVQYSNHRMAFALPVLAMPRHLTQRHPYEATAVTSDNECLRQPMGLSNVASAGGPK